MKTLRNLIASMTQQDHYEIREDGLLVYTMHRGNLDQRWHLYDASGKLISRNSYRNDIFEGLKHGDIK